MINIKTKQIEREHSIDLLKFFSICSIIILHLLGNGGLTNPSINTGDYVNVYRVICSILLVSVNIFGIITGYLYADKKIYKNKRIVEIVITTIFYSMIITAIFYVLNLYDVRKLGKLYLINSIFPSMVGRYWYITCYILLFFMIPYLNIFIENINKNQHKKILALLFFLFSIVTELGTYDFFRIEYGYSPFWLIYLYMIGAYIKKYGINIDKKKAIFILTFSIIANTIIMLIAKNWSMTPTILKNICNNYNSPLIVISSIIIFYLFKKANIRKTIFSKLGKYSLCVLIIHSHRLIYDWIIKNNMLFINKYNIAICIVTLLGMAIVIYLICVAIEKIKIVLFKYVGIEKLSSTLGILLDKKLNTNNI